ncbi:hypothetical protein QH639_19285 [Lysinibacillus sp. 1 U-2021]|uniref:hypothetical protein n=1 Tax=Lysinibacillus sp. 1 U-2021 TaxID=3039426 RepID=UPI0024810E02|nr:hypothetical protein [Lysinibacillus sp. 1 U-2021]WGT37947.1 hypothetical protein QH639_19285 [Lysinibacillus sp. 1 U-2021]
MDKATFDMIKKFHIIENDIYDQLCAKGMEFSEVEDLLNNSVDYREQLLRIGKYLVKKECLNKDTFIKENYQDIEKYIKLNVIYEYDNGMALCETTSGLFYLVPQNLLSCNDEEVGDVENEIQDDENNSQWVVSYLDLIDDDVKTLFFESKEEAEAKYKEVKSNKNHMSELIQSKSQYDQFELGLID